jgi:hypothetical protein
MFSPFKKSSIMSKTITNYVDFRLIEAVNTLETAYLTEQEDAVTTGLQLGQEHLHQAQLTARLDKLFVCNLIAQTLRLDILRDEIWVLYASMPDVRQAF